MTEHEELLMLRVLAEKQAHIIEEQEKKIEKQNIQLDNMI